MRILSWGITTIRWKMAADFFGLPILNSPYEYPSRHWELDESGQPTRKPHPLTYTTTAERMGLDVAECLFVDDMAVNIEGSESVGMPGL